MTIPYKLLDVLFWLRAHAVAIVAAIVALIAWRMLPKQSKPQSPIPPGDAKQLADALHPALIREADKAGDAANAALQDAVANSIASEREKERVRNLSTAEILKETEAYAARKRAARKAAGLLVLLAFVATPTTARAADDALPQYMAHPTSHSAGWWIPDDVWRDALADASSLQHCTESVQSQSNAVSALQLQVGELRNASTLASDQSETLRAQLMLADQRVAAQRERADAANRWYRSPRFLVTVGAVAGAIFGAFVGVEAAK